jgi:ligand-binding sensor domain-containing protein
MLNKYCRFCLFLFIVFAMGANSFAQWTVYDFNGATTGTGYNIDHPISIKVAPSQGGIWVGTVDAGVFNFDETNSTWTSYDQLSTSGFVNDYINSIDINGNQIVANTTYGGVETYLSGTWTSVSTTDGLADNDVWGTAYDGSGVIWYATYSGLSKKNNTTWQTYNTGNSTGMPTNHLYCIHIDINDKWLGSAGYGLLKFNTSWQKYNTGNSGISSNNVNKIVATPDGTKLWVCTDNGLALFDKNSTWTVYNSANTNGAITDNNIKDIAVDLNTGNIFLATPAGLVVRWANGTWKSWNTGNSGLPENSLTCVGWNSASGDVWMGTNSKGIVKVSQTVLSVEKSIIDQNLFVAYPNPVLDELTIAVGLKSPVDNMSISIIDIYGREVFNDKEIKSVSGNFEKHISMTNLSAGVYTLRIEAEGETATKKIIKY